MVLLPLERIVTENEGWLATRVLRYADDNGYTRYVSTHEEDWRLSVAGLSQSLIQALHSRDPLPDFTPDADLSADPVTSFCVEEAHRHRTRGISLGMFLGLMKYYRRSYFDLVRSSSLDGEMEERCLHFVAHFFDRVEISFCTEWGAVSDSRRLDELEERVGSRTVEILDVNERLMREIGERRRAEDALRRSEHFFHAIIDSLSAHVAILNREGDILAVNRAWRRFADENGYRGPNYCVGDNYFAICDAVRGDDAVTASAASGGVRELIAGRCDEFHLEYSCHSPTERRWFQVRATLLENESEGLVAMAHENISEVKHAQEEILALNRELEQRVCQRTRQLELSTRELEEFCYAVSHDLRAHLARIEGFGRSLFEDCSGKVDEQTRYYVDRICRISVELRRVVDALLELARISRSELEVREIDLGAIAENVVEELRRGQPLRRVDTRISPHVTAFGDPRLLGVVLRNLLDNAWKFTTRRENARVEFGVMQRHGLRLYFIRDNGAGFDQRYAGRLFQPFQRLHSPGEFEGLGIGLATVQRIIQLHGGRIWAESEKDKGATIYFTLPPQ